MVASLNYIHYVRLTYEGGTIWRGLVKVARKMGLMAKVERKMTPRQLRQLVHRGKTYYIIYSGRGGGYVGGMDGGSLRSFGRDTGEGSNFDGSSGGWELQDDECGRVNGLLA